MSAAAWVDLDAIRTCVAACARAAGPAAVMAVVKADGYGHGLVPSARAALAGGASWLGTAHVAEALELRSAGITAPVLSWLNPPGAPFAQAVAAGVDVAASARWALDELDRAATEAGRPARVHLKADTGLGRGGATTGDWPPLLARAAKLEAAGTIEVVGVMSHLAQADVPSCPTTDAQLERFQDAVAQALREGLRPAVRHLANSAATFTRPDARFDLVRPGLACYGLSPVPAELPAARLGLVPAMTLTASVALVKRVPAGQGVSYGHRWHAPRETTLALVPLGYADGVPRSATNIGEVLAAGARRRIAGTVCMDQFVIDVGDDEISAGDEVVVFGPGSRGEPTVEEWAARLDTLSYEIVSRIGARVPRRYLGEAP